MVPPKLEVWSSLSVLTRDRAVAGQNSFVVAVCMLTLGSRERQDHEVPQISWGRKDYCCLTMTVTGAREARGVHTVSANTPGPFGRALGWPHAAAEVGLWMSFAGSPNGSEGGDPARRRSPRRALAGRAGCEQWRPLGDARRKGTSWPGRRGSNVCTPFRNWMR